MEVDDLKWYSPFFFFVGAILGFADPITDILTLVEFYRTDHNTWFIIGLTFVFLPCLVFPVLFRWFKATVTDSTSRWAKTALCAFHPFSPAFGNVEALLFCLQKWRSGGDINPGRYEEFNVLLSNIDLVVLFEAALESAPQFIIQLYVISVQEGPPAIIQIISLPISFLAVAYAFTVTDKWSLAEREIIPSSSFLNVKHHLALYVTHLFLLSSRLFAICYFTVSYKWWVFGVLSFHSCAVVIATVTQKRDEDGSASNVFFVLLFMVIHWLRDDLVESSTNVKAIGVTMNVFFSHILFVLENFFMILMFYFTYHPNTWYSLPVTVSVCVLSVLSSALRIFLLHCLSLS